MRRKIGIVFGMEGTFPAAVVERINEMQAPTVTAEFLQIGGVRMNQPSGYRVIIDRISHDIPFYRAYLKNAVLDGAIVINNPFWWGADDKFFNYALAERLGVAVPRTVILPHKEHPPGTTSKSMRNLIYPLNWDDIFAYVGFPAFLKPFSGGGWKSVYKVHSPDELFRAYNETGDLCMTLQQSIEFDEYFRCYVVGREKVHVMPYEPRNPHHERYVKDSPALEPAKHERIVGDCLKLCRALGYDLNTVELAFQGGVPYAIDFLNPAPDADYHSVGPDNFAWIVNAVAELAVSKALSDEQPAREYHWSNFLSGGQAAQAAV
jgi:glutathione synthase/RimK-type ligase-like ATP-grasp enzyme